MTYYGIDVSHWNGFVDFNKVKESGKSFVFIKLANLYDDIYKLDPMFIQNYKNAKQAGLNIGAYAYCYSKIPGKLLDTCKNLKDFLIKNEFLLDYPLAFDLEEISLYAHPLQKENNTNLFKAFNEVFESAILYSNSYFLNHFIDSSYAKDIWVADYRSAPPENCVHGNTWKLWQYAGDNGTCPGVTGPCDLDVLEIRDNSDHKYKKMYKSLKYGLQKLLADYSLQ